MSVVFEFIGASICLSRVVPAARHLMERENDTNP